MRKKDIIEKLNQLDGILESVLGVQNQLLEKLGYVKFWQLRQSSQQSVLRIEKKTTAEPDSYTIV